jgi:hypothetical protein
VGTLFPCTAVTGALLPSPQQPRKDGGVRPQSPQQRPQTYAGGWGGAAAGTAYGGGAGYGGAAGYGGGGGGGGGPAAVPGIPSGPMSTAAAAAAAAATAAAYANALAAARTAAGPQDSYEEAAYRLMAMTVTSEGRSVRSESEWRLLHRDSYLDPNTLIHAWLVTGSSCLHLSAVAVAVAVAVAAAAAAAAAGVAGVAAFAAVAVHFTDSSGHSTPPCRLRPAQPH